MDVKIFWDQIYNLHLTFFPSLPYSLSLPVSLYLGFFTLTISLQLEMCDYANYTVHILLQTEDASESMIKQVCFHYIT